MCQTGEHKRGHQSKNVRLWLQTEVQGKLLAVEEGRGEMGAGSLV